MKNRQVQKMTSVCRKNIFLISILLGVIGGVIIGAVLRTQELNSTAITLISYPGELFMRALKLLVLPFIVSCIIIGTASLNISKNKRVAIRTLVYFVLTSILNVIFGISLALIMQPGNPSSFGSNETTVNNLAKPNIQQTTFVDGFLDMGRNIIADNLFQATFQQTYTKYEEVKRTNGSSAVTTHKKTIQMRDGTNMMGIIFFSVVFGSTLGTMGSEKEVVLSFFSTVYGAMQRILTAVIWCTPIGVASIICGKIVSVPNLLQTLHQLSFFILGTVGGFLFYQLIVVQLIYFAIIRKNPFTYYFQLMPAIATAFSTASKSASLPVTMHLLEEKLNMNKKITRFVLPIGTINMDGSALYLSFSVIFLAQLSNMSLSLAQIITIGLACTITSMSSAAIPSAAIVLLIMLCTVVNISPNDVGMLLAIDWFVDRFRTVNNLLGDCYTVAVVQFLSNEELQDDDNEKEDRVNACRSTSIELNEDTTITNDKINSSHQNGIDNTCFKSGEHQVLEEVVTGGDTVDQK